MMPRFSPRTLARAAGIGALAAGCALAGLGAGPANAATVKPVKHATPARAVKPARAVNPATPRGLAVKDGSVTTEGATLIWDADRGATSYRVVIVSASTPSAAASYDSGYTLAGRSVTVSTLRPGTAYQAKISAKGRTGVSGWSRWVLFYTTGAPGPAGARGPQGPRGPRGPRGPSGIVSTKTHVLQNDPTGTSDSISTGGSFASRAKLIGTVTLPGGTYLLSLNFMATPNLITGGAVFPQGFVYDGAAMANFSNDLFNIGSGALAPFNASSPADQVNSYYSGTSEITVPADGETLDVYAFGYDSDHGAGSYELNAATLTATALNVAHG